MYSFTHGSVISVLPIADFFPLVPSDAGWNNVNFSGALSWEPRPPSETQLRVFQLFAITRGIIHLLFLASTWREITSRRNTVHTTIYYSSGGAWNISENETEKERQGEREETMQSSETSGEKRLSFVLQRGSRVVGHPLRDETAVIDSARITRGTFTGLAMRNRQTGERGNWRRGGDARLAAERNRRINSVELVTSLSSVTSSLAWN